MILTAGCSWTEQYHDLFPVWPHLLNKPVKNIGESGTNNLEIANGIMRGFYKGYIPQHYDKVLILWTHWLRGYALIDHSFTTRRWKVVKNRMEIDGCRYYGKREYITEILKDSVVSNVYAIHAVQSLLERCNIDYYMIQGLNPFYEFPEHLDLYLEMISYTEHLINQDKFYKWPPFPEVGGFNCDYIVQERENRMSEHDYHPSAKGSQLIADLFLKHAF
tara:strand:- start:107 stop:763 length:657 start_codon:yes stop_codon:yes gene_type:complete